MATTRTRKRVRKPRVRVRKRKSKSQINEEAKFQINQSTQKQAKYWLLTPKGKCPVPLDGKSPIDIDRWIEGVKKTGNHTVQSVCYWIRDFYEVFSDDYKDVKQYIHQNHKTLDLRNAQFRSKQKDEK